MTARELVDRFGVLMGEKDVSALAGLYSADAKVILFYDIASGRDEIRQLMDNSVRTHGSYRVISIDQFQDAGDIVMWDATVMTDTGPLLTTHVVLLDDEGLIKRHVPGIRGYWGM
jgi:ketosteroid isomerase-like protein